MIQGDFFKGLSGGNTKIDVIIDDPSGRNIHTAEDRFYEWFDSQMLNQTGVYKICFRNSQGSEKRIFINIVANSNFEASQQFEKQKLINETHSYMNVGPYLNIFIQR